VWAEVPDGTREALHGVASRVVSVGVDAVGRQPVEDASKGVGSGERVGGPGRIDGRWIQSGALVELLEEISGGGGHDVVGVSLQLMERLLAGVGGGEYGTRGECRWRQVGEFDECVLDGLPGDGGAVHRSGRRERDRLGAGVAEQGSGVQAVQGGAGVDVSQGGLTDRYQ
jgi:hypothetical protein